MVSYRTQSALNLLVALILTGSAAHAEIKGDAIRIGVLTDMNDPKATDANSPMAGCGRETSQP
jgi:branched-chain amino acid transport system substrate-binding protein